MDIMMKLEGEALTSVYEVFKRKQEATGDGLTLEEFIACMVQFLTPPEAEELASWGKGTHTTDSAFDEKKRRQEERVELVSHLIDLFAQIDVNGDGSLEWEEFTSFCIEAGMSASKTDPSMINFSYEYDTKYTDHTTSGHFIRQIKYHAPSKTIWVIEGDTNVIQVYDTSMKIIHHLKLPDSGSHDEDVAVIQALDLVFLDEVKRLAIPTSKHNIMIWVAAGDFYEHERTIPVNDYPRALCWSSVRKALVVGLVSGELVSCEIGSGASRPPLCIKAHSDIILDVVECKHFEKVVLLTTGLDKKLFAWEPGSMRQLGALKGAEEGIKSFRQAPQIGAVFGLGFTTSATAWDINTQGQLMKLPGHKAPLTDLQLLHGYPPRAITADEVGHFKCWDITKSYMGNGVCLFAFQVPKLYSFVPRTIAVTGKNDLVIGALKIHIYRCFKQAVESLPSHAIYNDVSNTIVTAAGTGIRIWSASDGKPLLVATNVSSAPITSISFDDRRRKLIVGNQRGEISVHNMLNMATMKSASVGCGMDVTSILYNTQDRCLITSSWDKTLRVYDEEPGDEVKLMRKVQDAHSLDISILGFSHLHSLIFTGSTDFTIRVWNFQDLRLEGILVGHGAEIVGVHPLDPLAGVLSVDAHGLVCLWSVRGQPLPYRLLRRFYLHQDTVGRAPASAVQSLLDGDYNRAWVPSPEDFKSQQADEGSNPFLTGVQGSLEEGDPGHDEVKDAEIAERAAHLERGDLHSVSVTDLTVHFHKHEFRHGLLYCGDDEGVITVVDITDMVVNAKLKIISEARSVAHRVSYNPHIVCDWRPPLPPPVEDIRRPPEFGPKLVAGATLYPVQQSELRFRSISSILNLQKAAKQFKRKRGVALLPREVYRIHKWKAHGASIKTLHFAKEINALITCSHDRRVRVWNASGELQGQLDTPLWEEEHFKKYPSHRPPWKLKVDLNHLWRNRRKMAERLLQKVNLSSVNLLTGRSGEPVKEEDEGSSMWELQVRESLLMGKRSPRTIRHMRLLEVKETDNSREEDGEMMEPEEMGSIQASSIVLEDELDGQKEEQQPSAKESIQNFISPEPPEVKFMSNSKRHEQFIAKHYRSLMEETRKRTVRKAEGPEIDTTPSDFLSASLNLTPKETKQRRHSTRRQSSPLLKGKFISPLPSINRDARLKPSAQVRVDSELLERKEAAKRQPAVPGLLRPMQSTTSWEDQTLSDDASHGRPGKENGFVDDLLGLPAATTGYKARQLAAKGKEKGSISSSNLKPGKNQRQRLRQQFLDALIDDRAGHSPLYSTADRPPASQSEALLRSPFARSFFFNSDELESYGECVGQEVFGGLNLPAETKFVIASTDLWLMSASTPREAERKRRVPNRVPSAKVKPLRQRGRKAVVKKKTHVKRGGQEKEKAFGPYPRSEVVRVKAMFDRIDVDQSGEISLDEFISRSWELDASFSKDRLEEQFQEMDKDHSGTVTLEELLKGIFTAATSTEIKNMQKYLEHIENKRRASVNDVLTSAQYKELKAIFEAYDKTSKGSISVDDFLKGMSKHSFSAGWSAEDAKELISQYDLDHNHALEFDEFVAMLQPLYLSSGRAEK